MPDQDIEIEIRFPKNWVSCASLTTNPDVISFCRHLNDLNKTDFVVYMKKTRHSTPGLFPYALGK
jgi:sorbitol-specific phosphotransferase system component IIC